MAESTHRTRGDGKDGESAPKREPKKAPPDPMAEKLSRRRDGTQPKPSQPNKTGLPDRLKNGVESLSGVSLDDVKVHRNSAKPAELGALAYAKGNEIHLGAGQEQHLPHEAWHVAQQKQGRVKPTLQAKGVPINDDPALEREADVEGLRALRTKGGDRAPRRGGGETESVAQALYNAKGTKKLNIHLSDNFTTNHIAADANAAKTLFQTRNKADSRIKSNTTATEDQWKAAFNANGAMLAAVEQTIEVNVDSIDTWLGKKGGIGQNSKARTKKVKGVAEIGKFTANHVQKG